MTCVEFFADGGLITGFSVSGHSSFDCEDTLGCTLCAAVSSAVYMTANTVTDVIGVKCDITEKDALFILRTDSENSEVQTVLKGFRLHIRGLREQYPERIKIIAEV